MPPLFHVSSAANRETDRAHGLDWNRMGAARGIAGSMTPEENGVFLCRDEFEARFFTDLNNTGGPVDVWVVTGVAESELVTGGSGVCYFPPLSRLPRSRGLTGRKASPWPALSAGSARPSSARKHRGQASDRPAATLPICAPTLGKVVMTKRGPPALQRDGR